MPEKRLTIPNLLSILRILVAPLLIVAALAGSRQAFLALFLLSLASDALDGFLARQLNQVSEWGSRLDSLGDLATYLAALPGMWLLWPDLVRQERSYLLTGLLAVIVPIVLGFVKFRRLTSYHTRAAKTAAILLGFAVPILLLGGPAWPFRGAVLIFLLAEIEEAAITLRLTRWQANIPSFRHLVRQQDK